LFEFYGARRIAVNRSAATHYNQAKRDAANRPQLRANLSSSLAQAWR